MRKLFTVATAREMGLRSAASRKQRQAERDAQRLRDSVPGPPDADYVAVQLARTRTHIERLSLRLERATDPLDFERLSRAMGMLREQERILAGRPLPGALRPSKPAPPIRPPIEPL